LGVEQPRDPLELVMSHLSSDVAEVKQDLRRLDDRLFQMMLLQLGTLATALASLVAVLAS
jgi:hypothetical protein